MVGYINTAQKRAEVSAVAVWYPLLTYLTYFDETFLSVWRWGLWITEWYEHVLSLWLKNSLPMFFEDLFPLVKGVLELQHSITYHVDVELKQFFFQWKKFIQKNISFDFNLLLHGLLTEKRLAYATYKNTDFFRFLVSTFFHFYSNWNVLTLKLRWNLFLVYSLCGRSKSQ